MPARVFVLPIANRCQKEMSKRPLERGCGVDDNRTAP
jgi:hypothetical protein